MNSDARTIRLTGSDSAAVHDTRPQYEIRVEGHLGSRWAAWFDGLSITNEADGTTVLRGPIVDQAALHGVLEKLRDVGIPLLSLAQISDTTTTEGRSPRHHEGN